MYPCDRSPCKNNGTCVNAKNTFKCTCTEQYEGDTCENRGLFDNIHIFLMLLKSSVVIQITLFLLLFQSICIAILMLIVIA